MKVSRYLLLSQWLAVMIDSVGAPGFAMSHLLPWQHSRNLWWKINRLHLISKWIRCWHIKEASYVYLLRRTKSPSWLKSKHNYQHAIAAFGSSRLITVRMTLNITSDTENIKMGIVQNEEEARLAALGISSPLYLWLSAEVFHEKLKHGEVCIHRHDETNRLGNSRCTSQPGEQNCSTG